MSHTEDIGEALTSALVTLNQGVEIIDKGQQARQERAAVYASAITALASIEASLLEARAQIVDSQAMIAEGANHLRAAWDAILTLGSRNDKIATACYSLYSAIEHTVGPHASIAAGYRGEDTALDGIITALHDKLETLGTSIGDTGTYGSTVRAYSDNAIKRIEAYAQETGIPLGAEDPV